MQKHALQTVFPHFFVELEIAVFRITRNRMTGIRRMHADLVRASRQDRHLEERGDATETLHRTKIAGRAFA
jgi:hypothetical protein